LEQSLCASSRGIIAVALLVIAVEAARLLLG
jgi:hypothetical protein